MKDPIDDAMNVFMECANTIAIFAQMKIKVDIVVI